MRMRRAHDIGTSRIGKFEIVDKSTLTGQETRILDPAKRVTDADF